MISLSTVRKVQICKIFSVLPFLAVIKGVIFAFFFLKAPFKLKVVQFRRQALYLHALEFKLTFDSFTFTKEHLPDECIMWLFSVHSRRALT